tara:strand:- start:493 stop:630 length:138 start_codon:yes stop_codon:yes gene_type:complete
MKFRFIVSEAEMLKNVYSGLYGFSPRVEILALYKALNLRVAERKI